MDWGVHYCKCDYIDDAGWPVLNLQVGTASNKHWLYLRGSDYLMYSPNYEECMIRMRGDLGSAFEDVWLLGVPFMQTYYTIHDMDNKKIGLVRVYKKPADEEPAQDPTPGVDGDADKDKEKEEKEPNPIIPKPDTENTDKEDQSKKDEGNGNPPGSDAGKDDELSKREKAELARKKALEKQNALDELKKKESSDKADEDPEAPNGKDETSDNEINQGSKKDGGEPTSKNSSEANKVPIARSNRLDDGLTAEQRKEVEAAVALSIWQSMLDIPSPLLYLVCASCLCCLSMVAFKHFKIKEMQEQVRDLEFKVQREQQRMEQTI